jgi:hypothetical protein
LCDRLLVHASSIFGNEVVFFTFNASAAVFARVLAALVIFDGVLPALVVPFRLFPRAILRPSQRAVVFRTNAPLAIKLSFRAKAAIARQASFVVAAGRARLAPWKCLVALLSVAVLAFASGMDINIAYLTGRGKMPGGTYCASTKHANDCEEHDGAHDERNFLFCVI